MEKRQWERCWQKVTNAVLARVIGQNAMTDVLTNAHMIQEALDQMRATTPFNAYCPQLWTAYPTKVDPKNMKGELLGETENPAAYIHRLRKRWREETQRSTH